MIQRIQTNLLPPDRNHDREIVNDQSLSMTTVIIHDVFFVPNRLQRTLATQLRQLLTMVFVDRNSTFVVIMEVGFFVPAQTSEQGFLGHSHERLINDVDLGARKAPLPLGISKLCCRHVRTVPLKTRPL